MDLSLVSGAVASITAAKEIGKAALGLRDFNAIASQLSEMNAKLLDAQERLFAHNTQLLALQQQYFEAAQQLAEAEKALSEKGRYVLFEIVRGSFAYRADARPISAQGGNPSASEPEHYICQPCFDGPDRRKATLRLHPTTQYIVGWWSCPVCNTRISLLDQLPPPIPQRRDNDGGPNGWMRY
ncbi:hypothetical protein [Burkholderia gladioli]|uniref:hypothetical protein n=1 Tax=Burkholderia gladioli TaxID=28095 RepID=UPI001641D5E4|nr:hypothetical protein [Burkholderia gladioli]